MKTFLFLASLLTGFALAGSGNLPQISTRVIQPAHVNDIRSALSLALVPRNTSGTTGDVTADLGTTALRWNTAYLKTLNLQNAVSGNALTFAVPTLGSPYTITWPSTVAGANNSYLLMDTSGNITTSGSAFTPQTSSSSGNYTLGPGNNYTDVTNLSVTITTGGKPVFVGLYGLGTTCYLACVATNNVVDCNDRIIRGASTVITDTQLQTSPSQTGTNQEQIPCSSIWALDAVAAGTYTYKAQTKTGANSSSNFFSVVLTAYEL